MADLDNFTTKLGNRVFSLEANNTINSVAINSINTSISTLNTEMDAVETTANASATQLSVTGSYVPRYVYEYAKYSVSNVKSAVLNIKLKNISGGTITLSGYQLWLNFKNSSGNTLAKPSTSTAFDAESYTELSMPGANVNDGDEYSYIIKLNNIDSELVDNDLTDDAVYWAIGFRQIAPGTVNLYQNNAILNFSVTIIPDV